MKNRSSMGFLILLVFLLNGCSYFSPRSPQVQTDVFSVDQSTLPILTLTVDSLSKVSRPLTFSDPIPAGMQSLILQAVESKSIDPGMNAQVRFATQNDQVVGNWIYVAATAFPSLVDEISEEQLQALWSGKPKDKIWTRLYIRETDIPILALKLGKPSMDTVYSIPLQAEVKTAWKEPASLFILPFEQVTPLWKVLKFDGVSIFSRPFKPEAYPLTLAYAFSSGNPNDLVKPLTNFDSTKMTTVLMTGVTALTRATGAKMDTEGVEFPASSIRDVLLDADLTHISNEVSFTEDCPLSDADQFSVMFCSRPEYFELLTFTDIDIVELSGNHLLDWSIAGFNYSLGLYEAAGMGVYAGGVNQQAARQPYKIELNGNKIAFLGCNPAGPPNVWATDTISGVADCTDDWMIPEVEKLVKEGYLPIVTMQHFETYSMEPNPYQKADFLNLSAHGAVIVSGSQAHLPQGMTFVGDHFVHYGLGNLFFDQMDRPVVGTRREFLDRHVIYDGKYIQTELITAMLEDYARPRIMTEEERQLFLTDIFTASGWLHAEEEK
jgi:hypothetical protein